MSLSATPVQSARGSNAASASTFTITLGATPAQYNTILVALNANIGTGQQVTQTGVSYVEVTPAIQNATGPTVVHIFAGFVWSASASTTITAGTFSAANEIATGIAAEFAGANVSFDTLGSGSGNTASPSASVTPNVAPSLVVSVHGTRGQWSAQTSIFSSPTNSFVLVDSTNGQSNSITNSGANLDRAVAMYVKYVSDTTSQACGSTITSGQWVVMTANFYEKQTGFMVQ